MAAEIGDLRTDLQRGKMVIIQSHADKEFGGEDLWR